MKNRFVLAFLVGVFYLASTGVARAQEFNAQNCAIGGLILGGIASIAGKAPGGYVALGCGAGSLVGRQASPSLPPFYPPVNMPPPSQYQGRYQEQYLVIPEVCLKYRQDSELLARCNTAYERQRSQIEQERMRAVQEQRNREINAIEQEARDAARRGW